MRKLIGIIHFSQGIPCRGDALDKAYSASINGVSVQLHFPKLIIQGGQDAFRYQMSIKKPDILQSTRDDRWGYVFSYNVNSIEKLAMVGTWIFQVVVTCEIEKTKFDSEIELLSAGINKWRSQMYERLCLLGKPIYDVANKDYFERQGEATGFELYSMDDYHIININGRDVLTAKVFRVTQSLTPDELQKLVSAIDTSKNLKNEYGMYLNALVEQIKGNTRYAVMEATTATELCVTQKIRERCDELGIDGKGLCDMYYRSLGDRFSLLRHLGIPLATNNPDKEIVKPRNDLFHNRKLIPTHQDCTKVLNAAKEYLLLYIPEMYE